MAQNFVGSNNINLLEPIGQYGSRHMGGKEAASARYIHTAMSKVARLIFRPEDDPLMEYQIEEGQKIEPVWYLPIIPMILVNGSEGIGTGWRSTIPNYNPREIVENLRRKLHGEDFQPMVPWFKNFKGAIKPSSSKKKFGYTCYGIINIKDETTVKITELPIRRWTRDYKDFLEEMIEGRAKTKDASSKESKKDKKKKNKKDKKKGKKKKDRIGKPKERKKDDESDIGDDDEETKEHKRIDYGIVIEDIKEYHKGHNIDFEIKTKNDCLDKIVKPDNSHDLIKAFRLSTSLPLTQLVCFDHNSKLKKYENELEIMEEFYAIRLEMYTTRKKHMLKSLERELAIISNKVRFILAVINEEVVLKRAKRKDLINTLYKKKFTPYSKFGNPNENIKEKILIVESKDDNEESKENKSEKEDEGMAVPAKEYDYLLRMALWSLTYEKVEELLKEKNDKEAILEALKNKTEVELWENDLDQFMKGLDEVEIGRAHV